VDGWYFGDSVTGTIDPYEPAEELPDLSNSRLAILGTGNNPPVNGGELKVYFHPETDFGGNMKYNTQHFVAAFDVMGRLVSDSVPLTDGGVELELGRGGKVAAGTYLIRIADDLGTADSAKVLVLEGTNSVRVERGDPAQFNQSNKAFPVGQMFNVQVAKAGYHTFEGTVEIEPGYNRFDFELDPVVVGDVISGMLVNNETGEPEAGQIKVFDTGMNQIGGTIDVAADGLFEIEPGDHDSYVLRARTLNELADTDSYVRTVRFDSPGDLEHELGNLKTVPTDNIQDLPQHPDYPQATPEQIFAIFAYSVMARGPPDGEHFHPWDWNGDVADYDTPDGEMRVAIVRNNGEYVMSQADINRAQELISDMNDNYSFPQPFAVEVVDTPDEVMNGGVEKPGYFVIMKDHGIIGSGEIGTTVDPGTYHMQGAMMKLAVNVSTPELFDKVFNIELASGLGCRDPAPDDGYWNARSAFSESQITEFSEYDQKLINISGGYETPEHMYDVLGIEF